MTHPDKHTGPDDKDKAEPTGAPAAAAPAVRQPRNPLHGVTLEQIVTALSAHYGWPALAQRIPVRCFSQDPSVSSSLKFLRKTPWAREKVEALWIHTPRLSQPSGSGTKKKPPAAPGS